MKIIQLTKGQVTRVDDWNYQWLNQWNWQAKKVKKTQKMQNQRKWVNCSSRFKGVSWHRKRERWVANIQIDGRLRHLGYFTEEEDAAAAYDRAAKRHFGEFCLLNKNNS